MNAHRPRRRFGQNFLTDPRMIERIIAAIHPLPTDHIVEIGPGQGALTRHLLAAGSRVTAIEIDRDLVEHLRREFGDWPGFEVVSADALTIDLDAVAQPPLRLVGNLPYNISTPLLFHALKHAAAIQDMHFMLQQEVVERMVAPPGSKTYGRLSVAIQLHARAERLLRVPPGAFFPPPKVQSAIVRLKPLHPDWPPGTRERLNTILVTAFANRRKTIRNAVSKLMSADALEAAGIDPGLRPENLSPDQYLSLATRA